LFNDDEDVSHGGLGSESSALEHGKFVIAGYRPQQHDVVGINHGGVRCVTVRSPYRSTVEPGQCNVSRVEIAKSAQPHEVIWTHWVAKLSEYLHSYSFLSFDELAVEQLDQRVTLSRVKQVLAKLN
jgi:hypothetical protein